MVYPYQQTLNCETILNIARGRKFTPVSHFDWGYVVAALLPLIGILPTFGDGVIASADGPLHVHRIYAMTTMLQSGDLWPRWLSWFHLGFGYPVFNYYPPAVFYLGGLLGLVGISAPLAFNLVGAAAWMLGSVGMYALARRFLPTHAALLAAMLWSYAPSRLYEVWHQGSLPQMLASAFVPLLFWGLVNAAQHPTRRAAVCLALTFAGLVFSHQPVTLVTALFFAPAAVLVPLWLSRANWQSLIKRCAAVFGGLLLGVGLTAIFAFPLALELRYVAGSAQTDDTIPYLISNFLQPAELFVQPGPMDLTDLRFELPTTFGLLGAILAGLGVIALVRRKQYGLTIGLITVLAVLCFMLVEASLPIWEAVPFLAQLRFPARLLRVGAVFLALFGGASVLLLPRRWQIIGAAVGVIIALISALPLVYPNQQFVNWDQLSAVDEIEYELTTAAWGTTSYDEFDPIWGERIPRPGSGAPEPEQYIADPLRVVGYRNDMNRDYPALQLEEIGTRTIRVTVTEERPVRFHQYYFPGWTATLDGQPVEVYAEDEFGLLTILVPPGDHIIELHFGNTPIRTIGTVVTLMSVALAGVIYFTSRSSQPAAETRDESRLSRRPALIIIGGITAFALINTLLITPYTRWFRYESPPDNPALMQHEVRQMFGDAFVLLGYSLDQTHVDPGGLLAVTLFWQPQKPLDRQYRPIVQLVNLEVSAAWGASEPFFPGGGDTRLGYTPDVFASDLHEIRIFDDAPPENGRISVQMIDVETGEALRLPDGSDRLILEPLITVNAR